MVKLGLIDATASRLSNVDIGTDTIKSAGVDIIFVHGLGSNPDKTWRAPAPGQERLKRRQSSKQDNTNSVCWPTDLLPDRLEEADRSRDHVWFYNYDSKWYKDAVHAQLVDFAKCMLHCIHDKMHPTNGNSNRKLIFVCHSYGGLVVKESLLRAHAEPRFSHIVERTKGVLFLGTPHRGTTFTNTGLVLASLRRPLGSGTSMLLELKHHSETLTLLNDKFLSLVEDYKIKTVDFFEAKETKYLSWLPGSLVVTKESAVMDNSKSGIKLSLNHSELNKFGEADDNFELVVGELMDMIQPLRGPVYVVPRRRIATYRARPSVSAQIDDFMSTNISTGAKVKPLVLHGLGGIGKTQLVLDYINRERQTYNPILWINAESTATIQSSFERCAKEMHLIPSATPPSEGPLAENASVEAVRRFLQEQDRTSKQWLVVFDNADHEQSFDIVKVLPHGPCANIVVTSRHPHLMQFPQNDCQRIHIKSMTPEESRALVLSHVFPQDGLESNDYVHVNHLITEQLVDEITELLGHFPLALDLAARYIVAENFGLVSPQDESVVQQALRRYIGHFRDHKTELLKRPDKSSEYNDNIQTVWNITLQGIERDNPGYYVSDLLTLLALMDRSRIQDNMFSRASKGFAEFYDKHMRVCSSMPQQLSRFVSQNSEGSWDDFYYSTAKNKLVQYGLLELLEDDSSGSTDTTMHSLVQWRARQRLEGTSWSSWLLVFFQSIASDILQVRDTDTPFTSQFCRALYFSYELMEPIERLSTAPSETILTAWYVIALVLREERMYEAAQSIIAPVLAAAKSLGDDYKLYTISCKELLASIHEYKYTTEDLIAAQGLRAEICTDYRSIYGDEHDSSIEAYTRIALLSESQGHLEEAKRIFRLVIQLKTKLHGIDHPDTLQAYRHYALVLLSQQKGEKAEEILTNVYEFQCRKLGPTHPDTIPTRNDLFYVLKELERYAEAQVILEGILEQLRRMFASDHEDVLNLLEDLQSLHQLQGSAETAENLAAEIADLRSKKKERLRKGITDSRWIGE